eukprot:6466023-Amphidinium_carterae.1
MRRMIVSRKKKERWPISRVVCRSSLLKGIVGLHVLCFGADLCRERVEFQTRCLFQRVPVEERLEGVSVRDAKEKTGVSAKLHKRVRVLPKIDSHGIIKLTDPQETPQTLRVNVCKNVSARGLTFEWRTFRRLAGVFDSLEVLQNQACNNATLEELFEVYGDIMYMIMSRTTVQAVMTAKPESSVMDIEKQVFELVSTSLSGKKLFGSTWKKVVAGKGVQAIHHADLLPDRRQVTLPYGPWCLVYHCRCVEEHGEAYLTLCLRHIAVALELLPALPCEDAGRPATEVATREIDSELLRESKAARKALKHFLDCSKERPGSDMLQTEQPQAIMKQNATSLETLDRLWRLDKLLVDSMVSDAGCAEVQRLWTMACLPTAEKQMTLQISLAESTKFRARTLMQWTALATQGQISTAHGWLSCLSNGEEPPVCAVDSTDFLQRCWSSLQFFVYARMPAAPKKNDEPEEPASIVFGSEALALHWSKEKGQPMTLEGLRYYTRFQWLLTESVSAAVLEKKTQLLASEKPTPEKLTKTSSLNNKNKEKKSEAAQPIIDDDDAMMALLRAA